MLKCLLGSKNPQNAGVASLLKNNTNRATGWSKHKILPTWEAQHMVKCLQGSENMCPSALPGAKTREGTQEAKIPAKVPSWEPERRLYVPFFFFSPLLFKTSAYTTVSE